MNDPTYNRPSSAIPVPAPQHGKPGLPTPLTPINNFFAWFFTGLTWFLVGLFLYQLAVEVLSMWDIQLTPAFDLVKAFFHAFFG